MSGSIESKVNNAAASGGSGSGTVTSVNTDSTTDAILANTSHVIGTSVATLTLNTQTANTALLGPTTGADAAPAFRALVAADLPGGTTGSGAVVLATSPTMSNPVVGTQSASDNSTKGASTAYVTGAISTAIAGVNPAVAVFCATTGAGDTSGLTYSNGVSGVGATLTGTVNTALTFDGQTLTSVNQRVLVKNDTQSPSGAFNGVYYLTQLQTGLLAPILTRALDFDAPSKMNSTGAIPVVSGTANATTSWVLTSTITTVGTNALTFTKFSINPTTILVASNNLSDVSTKATAFNNLSPMSASGDIIYGGGSGAGTRLPKGTDGQALLLSSGLPAWGSYQVAKSEVWLYSAGGVGSATNNKIVWWNSVQENTGTDIVYASDHTNGDTLTIGATGLYFAVTYMDGVNGSTFGFSLNQADLTKLTSTISVAERLAFGNVVTQGLHMPCSWAGWLTAGDVVRLVMSSSIVTGDSTVSFRMVRLL